MEIGVPALLLLIGLGILWAENTKTGDKFITWAAKKFCHINLDELS